MKASLSKIDREFGQAERGLAAQRLIEDPLIAAWFTETREALVNQMLSAPISDNDTRRDAAVEVKLLDGLQARLRAEASFGRRALDDIEKRKAKS